MDIKLNFINHSNDTSNSDIVIFQKNVATDFEELAVAWKVIKYCGQGDYHPFVFPMAVSVGASDSYGNYTPSISAENGQLYHVVRTASGDELALVGAGTSPKEIQLRNDLPAGAVNAFIYRDGRLLASRTNITPGQKAVFEFKPTLWIGAVSQLEEGQVMNSAIISDINTELSLLGIASADIVMTGGGPGPGAMPYTFTLTNAVAA